MKRRFYGIAALVVVGCSGLASSNGRDAGGDRGPTLHMDSGPADGGTVPHDAGADVPVRDARLSDAQPDSRADSPSETDSASGFDCAMAGMLFAETPDGGL